MSIVRPFSSSEISNLREIFEKNGFKINGHIENYFRYSISTRDKILIIILKFPIELPLRMNIPFEVACFRICMVLKLWNLTQKAYKILIYLLKMLRNLALQVSMEHHFPVEGFQKKIVNLLNIIMPDLIKNENEKAWLARIRISLLNKRHKFEEFENKSINNLVETLNKAGLKPTFEQPWEIKKGIPKIRTSETLLFSSEEEQEFFILEKGYFTYFKDLEYNKIYLRSLFESYTPYLLSDLYRDLPEFKIDTYLENWIKFARLLLNSMIEILDAGEINKSEFLDFRAEKELDSEDFELEENNFSFSALHYESRITKDLYPLHNDLFDNPPSNFEVIESIQNYTKAEELIKNFKFKEASEILDESLKVFNKYKQKKAVVSILLYLRKIASLLNQKKITLNYLQNALEVAKTGEVPKEYILRIHYQLGKTYFKLKDHHNALNHFKIIITSLENEKDSITKVEYLGMASLYIGLIYLEQKEISKSKIHLKKAFYSKSEKVKLKYHLLYAKYFKNKGNLSKAHKLLKMAFSEVNLIEEKHVNLLIDLMLELAEFTIHYRKAPKKALHYLNAIKSSLSQEKISGFQRTLRWNLLMSDFYKLIKDDENSAHHLRQGKTIKNQLRVIGVIELD
ncbi:MAG: tol-pal system YbgF family protein [Candidatus Hodarchaeota archaeon]